MKWKEIKKHNRVESASMRAGEFKLSVHHYIGCGETWFTSSFGLFTQWPLKSKSIDDAKAEALAMLKERLETALREIE